MIFSFYNRFVICVGLGLCLLVLNSCEKDNPQLPIADFDFYVPENCDLPCLVEFQNKSQHADSYIWRFGTGDGSDQRSPSFTYEEEGTYLVELEAVNGAGRDTRVRQLTFTDEGVEVLDPEPAPQPSPDPTPTPENPPSPPEDPTACFSVENDGCEAPCSVRFDNCSEDAVRYEWDFGDGDNSTASNPRHTYQTAGEYKVTLRAYNADGAVDRTDEWVEVKKAAPRYSRAVAVGVEVFDIPLYPNLWDWGKGPDVYYAFSNGRRYSNVSGIIQSAAQTPLWWRGEVPLDNDDDLSLHFFDYDGNGNDQFMGDTDEFNIQDLIDDGRFPDRIDISNPGENLGVRIYLEWRK